MAKKFTGKIPTMTYARDLLKSLEYFIKLNQNYTMKNLINFKSILVPSICIAGMFFLASSCTERRTLDSKNIAEQENFAKLTAEDRPILVIENDNDAKFLMDAAEMQLEGISLGKLAQQKGDSPHVRELGKMMEEDHATSLTELKALAQSKSVSIPTSITEDSKDAYEKLEDKTGNDFGQAYSSLMVEHCEDAIELFEKASSDSGDPEIRSWASKKLPVFRTHLEHAKACKKECDEMQSKI